MRGHPKPPEERPLLEVTRGCGITTVKCHACFIECESRSKVTPVAITNLPCRAEMRDFSFDESERVERMADAETMRNEFKVRSGA